MNAQPHFLRTGTASRTRPPSAPSPGAPIRAETHSDRRLRASSRFPPRVARVSAPLPLPAMSKHSPLKGELGRGGTLRRPRVPGGGWREPTYISCDHGIHTINSDMILVYTFQNLSRAAVARHTVAPVDKRCSPLLLPHLVRPAARLERLTTLAARMYISLLSACRRYFM